jgi:peptidoglycan/LPS O-acetylase OafA/YrhL
MSLAYRSDIDGLRGIAVLAVVLYHFGARGFSGGYVGVDVFFVVSGYLITGIVLREIQRQEFSLAKFYERRIRRIFPALFVTVAFALIAGAILSTPANFENLGRSSVAVTLFVSNLALWSESGGYFDPAAAHKPLLHTWSLSVEEQFYILYPLLLVIVWRRFGSNMVRWLACLAAASLALSVFLVWRQPEAAFYWAPTRGWELLLGGLLVCAELPAPGPRVRDALAVLGLAAIVASVWLFDSNTPFPGLSAALPTVGTALILYTGSLGTTVVSRVLNIRLLVGVGLISYSLYLLHWPLLVFAQQLAIVDLTTTQKAGLLIFTLVLAAASWNWVELPFRSKQRFTRRQVFAGGASAMTFAGAVGLAVAATGGLPHRFETPAEPDWTACNFRLPGEAQERCTIGSDGVQPTFLVWGDSHAYALRTAIDESASRQSRAGYLAFGSGCPAILMEGAARPRLKYGPNSPQCRQFNDRMLEYIQAHPELKTIVLVARWFRYGDMGGDMAAFSPALRRMLSRLSAMGRTAVIVNQVPEVGYDVAGAYRSALLTRRDLNDIIAPTREQYARSNHRVLATFDAFQREGIRVIDMRDRLCDVVKCRIVDSGHPLYLDDNHLSDYGSHYVSPLFDPVLSGGSPRVLASR